MNLTTLASLAQEHYLVLGILIMALVTFITRIVPFLVFDKHKPGKAFRILQTKLPATILVILVAYSLQSTPWENWSQVLITFICLSGSIGLHLWKRNALISIFIPTIVFMALQYI